MATRSATVSRPSGSGPSGRTGSYVKIVWSGITENDDGEAVSRPSYPDKTVQGAGDFGANGAITMEGSPDGTNWGTLRDHAGTDIIITDETPRLIAENTLWIRPRATAGTAMSANVTIVGLG